MLLNVMESNKNRGDQMKKKVFVTAAIALLLIVIVAGTGCSYFSRPSDEEIAQAVRESEFFTKGAEGITILSPITVVHRGERKKDGAWPVTVKVTFTYKLSTGKTVTPLDRSPNFLITKDKDAAGKTIWKATLGV